MAIRRVYRADHDCHVRVDGARILNPPWGLSGGHHGGYAAIETTANLNHGQGMLRKGDLITVITGGSGGYGSPALRTPEAVAQDLREGRIDPATARHVYAPALIAAQ